MKVVSISLFLPSDKIPHAGGLYVYQHLAWLARHHEVAVLAPDTTDNRAAMAADGIPNVASHCWPIRPSAGVASRAGEYLRWVAAGLNPGLSTYEGLGADNTALAALAGADLIELQFTPCLAWIELLRDTAPGVPVVVVCHDIETQATLSRARHSSSLRLRIQEAVRYPRVRRQEVRWTNRTDLALVFSEKDARHLRQLGVRVPVATISPFVKLPDPPPAGAPRGSRTTNSSRPRVILVAAFDRASNEEGAWWLLQKVWPRVTEACPGAQLRLVGARPSKRLLAAGTSPGVVVTGFQENLEEEYRSATLAVAPLRTGAGVKFKVLQALAYGLPVVSTTIGVEGVEGPSDPRVLQVADDPGDFADAVLRAVEVAGEPEIIGAGRSFVEARYCFATSMQEIVERYENLTNGVRGPHESLASPETWPSRRP